MNLSEIKAINAYKGALGWKEQKDGDRNSPSHKILSIEDYSKLTSELEHLKFEIQRKERECERSIYKLKAEYESRISTLQRDYLGQISSLQNDLAAEKQLNKNLKRICKERANTSRGLKPIKMHSGFILLSTSSYIERASRNEYVLAFKTVVQTPYDILMDLNSVNVLWWKHMPVDICDIQFCDVNLGQNKSYNLSEYNRKGENHIFKYNLKAQKNHGFWEVEMFHSKPISGTCFSIYDDDDGE